ncbi:MAG: hypothetical protein IPJ52_05750 [Rhodocyclaceae bacterium]|nr:hypothetical protein [Rhodocyclaceae bacterium]
MMLTVRRMSFSRNSIRRLSTRGLQQEVGELVAAVAIHAAALVARQLVALAERVVFLGSRAVFRSAPDRRGARPRGAACG